MLTQAEALTLVDLAAIKRELRIPENETSHDKLLSEQIFSAANFVQESTGADLTDLAVLRPAIVSAVRSQYDGGAEIGPDAAHNSWMAPFRSYAPPE